MDYFLFCSLYPSSLIIACGRVDSDRRQDVVKLCGLLRSDGIFPSAVTLGQYTRAIAEGYSKQNSGTANSIISEAVRDNIPSHEEEAMERLRNLHIPNVLDFLDGNIVYLDDAGARCRQGREVRRSEKANKEVAKKQTSEGASTVPPSTSQKEYANQKQRYARKNQKAWLPVSTSFSPHWRPTKPIDESIDLMSDFRFIAL